MGGEPVVSRRGVLQVHPRIKFFDALGMDLVYSAVFNPMMKVADHEHNP
jgi:hypothetical protein